MEGCIQKFVSSFTWAQNAFSHRNNVVHNGSCLWPAHKNFLKYIVPTDWPLCKKPCHGKVSSTPLHEPSCCCPERRLLQDERCGGTSPEVLWLRLGLPMQGAQVRSLIGELKCGGWHGCGQKEKKKRLAIRGWARTQIRAKLSGMTERNDGLLSPSHPPSFTQPLSMPIWSIFCMSGTIRALGDTAETKIQRFFYHSRAYSLVGKTDTEGSERGMGQGWVGSRKSRKARVFRHMRGHFLFELPSAFISSLGWRRRGTGTNNWKADAVVVFLVDKVLQS